ncbi:MAG: DUF2130 domain-containing protein [Leadbetterella sp.]
MSILGAKSTCPKCGHSFDAGEMFQVHLDLELKKQSQALQSKLDEDKKKFIDEEKRSMWALALKKAEEKNELELKQLKEENTQKQAKILESEKKELELLKKERELNEQKELLKIQLEKDLLVKTRDIEEQAKKKKDEEFDLVKKEYEKKLEDQMNLVKEMQRKAEQGSMQLQGEVQELAIEQILGQAFPFDQVEEIKKGQRGADAILTVLNEFGHKCGKIVIESKRTQNFGGDWIEKLRDDQRLVGADIAVLITQTMPKEMTKFGEKEGVWICNFSEFKSVIYVLRQILIRSKQTESAQENKTEKMGLLYNYLTSSQFKHQIEAIVEGFSSMKEDLDKEKRAMQRIWKEREMQLDKVLENTVDMYGSIRGIAGNAIAPIKKLELGE